MIRDLPLLSLRERDVGHENCVSFEGLKFQISADRHRCSLCESKSHRAAPSKRTNGYHARPKEACYIRFIWQGNKTEQYSCRVNPPLQLRNELNKQFNAFQSGQFICYKSGHFHLLLTLRVPPI